MSAARARTAACSAGARSSSRRKCRTVMAFPRAGRSPRCSGQAPANPASVGRGHGQRRREPQPRRAGVVEQEAALLGAGDDGRGRLVGQLGTEQQSPPLDGGHLRHRGQHVGQLGAAGRHGGRAARRPRWCRARPARRRRRPGCRRRWCRGCRARAGRRPPPRPTQAPIGMPPPRPLASVTTSGAEARASWANQRAGPADAGLHLVEPQQRAVVAGDPPGGGEVAVGRHDDTGLALDRLQHDRRGLVGHGRGERLGVAVGHAGDVAGQRLERLAGRGLVGERQRAHRPAVEGALGGDQVGPAGAPGELEGGLVGLGAGVGEEHPAVGAEQAEQPLGELDLRLGGEEVGDVARASGAGS